MPRYSKVKLTKTVVDKLEPRSDRRYFVWCRELPRFGICIHPSGRKVYFIDYSAKASAGVRTRIKVGDHGVLTVDEARKKAIEMLGSVIGGQDPGRERRTKRTAVTMKELCERYLEAAERGLIMGKGRRPKKTSTIYSDRGRIERHIIPLLGKKRVIDITKADANRFMRDVTDGKTAVVVKTEKLRGKAIVEGGIGTASRTLGLLGSIMTFAVSEGIIESSPTRGISKPASNRRTRRLTPKEYRLLGKALEVAQTNGEHWQAISGVWLFALTGCRSKEIRLLTWDEIDLKKQRLDFKDTKEGESVRPLGKAAAAILKTINKHDGSPFVLTGIRKGEGAFASMPIAWKRILKDTPALAGVTPHTLRHAFASAAADLGYSDSTIASMLGHALGNITSRYIHRLDAVLIEATNVVSETIYGFMTTDQRDEDEDTTDTRTIDHLLS